MSDESKKKGGKRMVVTNIRVTKETHAELQALSRIWDMPMSDAISKLIRENIPEVGELISKEEDIKQKARKRGGSVN